MIYGVYSPAEQESFGFVDGLIPSLICIVLVFLILFILTLILSGINKIKALDEKKVPKLELPNRETKRVKFEDIKDEDMMAAVLVATIDYREEVKTDVELINVKEI